MQLEKRLAHLPDGMMSLFKHLLEREDSFYIKNPQPFLGLIHHVTREHKKLTLFDLLLATQQREALGDNMGDHFTDDSMSELNSMGEGFENEVLNCCSQLAETIETTGLDDSSESFMTPSSPHLAYLMKRSVRLVHRTAYDFLLEEGRTVLERYRQTEVDCYYSLAVAKFSYCRLRYGNQPSQQPALRLLLRNFPSVQVLEMLFWLEKALSDRGKVQRCCDVLDAFTHHVSQRISSDGGRRQEAYWFHEALSLRSHCPQLDLVQNLSIALGAWYPRIMDLWLFPQIQSWPQSARAQAAAYALYCIWCVQRCAPRTIINWIEMAPSSTTVHVERVCTRGLWASVGKHSLWQHFCAWGYYSMCEYTEYRTVADQVLQIFLGDGLRWPRAYTVFIVWSQPPADKIDGTPLYLVPVVFDHLDDTLSPRYLFHMNIVAVRAGERGLQLPTAETAALRVDTVKFRPRGLSVWLDLNTADPVSIGVT